MEVYIDPNKVKAEKYTQKQLMSKLLKASNEIVKKGRYGVANWVFESVKV